MLLSLMALYNHDNTILSDDYLNLPEDVNHETMVMRLLVDLAELEILIPNPDVLKQAIKFWSLSRLSQWERMVLALTEEYNPLHNYDRYEEWEDTDSGTGSATDTKTGSGQTGHNSTLTKAGTVTTDENESIDTTSSESGSSQTDVAGFNSSSYAPKDKTTGTSSGTGGSDRDLDSTVTTAGTDTLAETGTSSNTETVTHSNSDSKTGAHEGHLYGNIGVTTSMQMLTEELKGRQTDIYQIIVDEFKRQFCLMVY